MYRKQMQKLALIECLLKKKHFDHKDLSPSANWEKFKKASDIEYCMVWTLLWAVFGCRLTTIPLVDFVINDLYSQDLCREYGTTSSSHREKLLDLVKDKYKVICELRCEDSEESESFHEWFTRVRHGPELLTSQESFLVRGAMPSASINHILCVRYEVDCNKWVVTDQYNPDGKDMTPIAHELKISIVYKITSPNRPQTK